MDQAAAAAQKPDNGTEAKQTLESVPQSIRGSGLETTLLSQLDCIARSPHLCQENDPSADAFGLRDMHCAEPSIATHTTESSDIDANLLNTRPPKGLSRLPPGFHNIAPCYSNPFQQDASLPLHNMYYESIAAASNMTTYSHQKQNTLFPLSSVNQSFDQPALSLSATDPSVEKNKPQTVSTAQSNIGSKMPYEQSPNKRAVGTKNTHVPFTPPKPTANSKADQEYSKDSGHHLHHQLFPNDDISLKLATALDKDIADAESQNASSVGAVGEAKPVGFVPGTQSKNGVETAAEAENVGQMGQDVAGTSRLATMARVQPSSTVRPQQQPATSNTKTDSNDSTAQSSDTADESKATQPPVMPGYPPPWLVPPYPAGMPPYPGAPFPYPFYPPWPYCPPMMPMMPHPMMPMVPMPYWMPPMHPAMRMRPQTTAPSADDVNDKTEAVSEAKP